MSAFGVSIPSTIAFPGGNHTLGGGHSGVPTSSSGHHTMNHSGAGTSTGNHQHSIASLSGGGRGSNRSNANSSSSHNANNSSHHHNNSNSSNNNGKNQEKNELTKACEANSNRVSYLPSALPSQPGFTRVVLDGKYTGYMRCVTCTDKIVLIKVRGDGNDYNFGRHNQKCHSKDGYSRSTSATGAGAGGPASASFPGDRFRADKEEVIQAMYKEPERIAYEGSGLPQLPGFQKVFVDGKYTGYMRCTNCTTKIALIKEKRKKDGTSYGGIFGVSNLVKHNASVHESKLKSEALSSDSDSDVIDASTGKRKRSNKDLDKKIKELKVKRLTTDIKEKETRMRESEDRSRYMARMDEKMDKMVKMYEVILDNVNRLNHVIVNGNVR